MDNKTASTAFVSIHFIYWRLLVFTMFTMFVMLVGVC